MQKVKAIGRIISFNELNFKSREHGFKKWIIPLIANMAETYNQLGIGAFDQAAFKEIRINKTKNIAPKYKQELEKKVQCLPVALMEVALKDWHKALTPIEQALEKIGQSVSSMYAHNVMDNVAVNLDHINIVDGVPVLDTDALRKDYQLVISSELQAEVYEELTKFQETYFKLTQFLKDRNYDVQNRPLIGSNGILHEYTDYELSINAYALINSF